MASSSFACGVAPHRAVGNVENRRLTATPLKFMPITSPIGGHGGWDPFYEPYMGKVDVGTLR